jgi:hypothetical protein
MAQRGRVLLFDKHSSDKMRRNTSARDIKKVITAGRSFVVNTSAADCSAKAIPCLPIQPASKTSSPDVASRMYRENKVERDNCKTN